MLNIPLKLLLPPPHFPLFSLFLFDRFPKGKWSFLFRFFTSSSTTDESVEGGVSPPVFPVTAVTVDPVPVPMRLADSVLDVDVEVVDNWEGGDYRGLFPELNKQIKNSPPGALIDCH